MDYDNHEFQPYLLILMRNDLMSMNPGKAIAQGSHATSDFTHKFEFDSSKLSIPFEKISSYQKWKNSTDQSFGTTIVVSVDEKTMNQHIRSSETFYQCGVITDPSYPIRDGKVTHHIELETCAWVFVDTDIYSHDLKKLPLFK